MRKMMGYVWSDYRSYIDLIQELCSYGVDFKPLEAVMRRVRITYAGHVERMENDRFPKIVMHAAIAGGDEGMWSKKGRPERAWRHCLKDDLKKFGIDFNTWQIVCQNRAVWRRVVDAGEKKFMKDWIDAKVKCSYDRHVKEAGVIAQGRTVLNPALVIKKCRTHNNGIIEQFFTSVENAINDDGHVTTGRGVAGVGATVTVRRGQQEHRGNNQTRKATCRRHVSKVSRLLEEHNDRNQVQQEDMNLYCVCQQHNNGKDYIMCVACKQWYHPKCVNYNVVNNHKIMKAEYKCGYCKKSKSWPASSSRPKMVFEVEEVVEQAQLEAVVGYLII
jgi:hypothetical protein